MDTKVQKIKTKRPKNADGRELARKVAELCSCSPRMVRYVLDDERGARTELGEKITIAATLLADGQAKLIADVKRVIHSLAV